MITEKDIPNAYRYVLAHVRNRFPGAIIAGGALRDLDCGLSPKDVDIFIPIDNKPDIQDLSDYFNLEPHTINAEKANQVDRTIYAIYHINHAGIEFELIFGTPDACDIYTFDINICQIQYDGNTISRTSDYMSGMANKVIDFVNPQGKKRMEERAARMQTKFPGFSIKKAAPKESCFNGY